MQTDDMLSRLIGDIYDAVLDPTLWPEALRQVRGFVGGSAAALFSKDASNKSVNIYYDDGGVDPHYARLYVDKYAKFDPASTGHLLSEIGCPVSIADLISYDELLETRFYKEWARPQGCVDFISAVLEKTGARAAMVGVFRHERHGLVDEETRNRMRLVVPHIRRASLIGRVIDLKTAEACTFADTLDRISAGMFLVDETSRVVHANAIGHEMLASAAVFSAPGGKLTAIDPRAARLLADIIVTAGKGDESVGTKGIAVPIVAREGDHYVAHVLPLTSGARRRTASRYAAVAALFVRKAALEVPSPPEAISKLYGLTPSELRVLLAIVQAGGVAETAQALGIGAQTVKTHLHRLFRKTGTSRQADLVKLIAGFACPL